MRTWRDAAQLTAMAAIAVFLILFRLSIYIYQLAR